MHEAWEISVSFTYLYIGISWCLSQGKHLPLYVFPWVNWFLLFGNMAQCMDDMNCLLMLQFQCKVQRIYRIGCQPISDKKPPTEFLSSTIIQMLTIISPFISCQLMDFAASSPQIHIFIKKGNLIYWYQWPGFMSFSKYAHIQVSHVMTLQSFLSFRVHFKFRCPKKVTWTWRTCVRDVRNSTSFAGPKLQA